jgi:uncharacterized protein YjbJ (UPF0337 family)
MTNMNIDKARGRLKEAAGVLSGDRELKHEGRVDQAKGSVKGAVDRIAGALGGNRTKDKQDATAREATSCSS